jgi:hypothetical protein
MTFYKDRLAAAMRHKGVKITALAQAIGMSYQGVKKVLDSESASLNSANNAAAARFLGVSSDWLASEVGDMLAGPPATDQPSLSVLAMELGRLFDMLPDDRILRARVLNATSEVILRALDEALGAGAKKPPMGG